MDYGAPKVPATWLRTTYAKHNIPLNILPSLWAETSNRDNNTKIVSVFLVIQMEWYTLNSNAARR